MGLSDFNALLSYAKYVSSHVEEVIYDLLNKEPQKLYDASKHLIKAGGKRLRPLALVLSGRMYGLPENLGFIAGAAVEILHNFTLVHDDIMDKDTFRRGVPTVHVLYGVDMAILAGDTLFAKAYEALGLLERYVPAERLVKAFKELTWAAVTVAEGQALDMDFEGRMDVSLEEYLTMIYKKTAALFKASLNIGALLAGAPEKELKLLSEFAEGVGIAFQIRDDVLGLVGDEKTLGKPIYSDLREGKKTVLVIYALSKLSNEEKERISKVLGNRSASVEELRKVAELIISTGAVDYAEKLADEYLSRGLNALNMTNPQDFEAKEMLKNLALYVTSRTY
ncbi:MAG: geranylgeranyl pyrophosphate synthase [Zestosphaera tikiterensis]|uniref:Geranylgeranyl pyrophosphate synthase n=1 Tax=Zestosphaera tikiterensis TaxID=1973259 RepID=A0A2R7Y5S4_9CREN|nr:MAG: geranylgeranyl pyrophosphate synthase [Zestosphaera tikiterensis]